MDLTTFFKELIRTFDQSTIAYRQYLDGGKTYQFAQQLKLYNGHALQLLKENASLLPGNLQEDVRSLITHYQEWSAKWEQLNAEKEFAPGEVFVFANDITFPKQAAQNLENFYGELTRKG